MQMFCLNYGINASGSKIELSERIHIFLVAGDIKKSVRRSGGICCG
ncbi:hypothetical protein ACQCWA_04615 [Rossellomorea aquimaris]